MSSLATMEYESAARECAGNHQKFDSFCWYDRPDDNPQEWGIVYTHNRDSGIIERCNAESTGKALAPFVESGDVTEEHHTHWACGWVDGYAIRVFRDGEITEAFRVYFDLLCKMDDYPILDESRLGEMELEESASAWDDWAAHDFESALEKRFKVSTVSPVDGAALKALFNAALDCCSECWHEDGGSMYIDVERVAKSVDVDAALSLLDTTVSEKTETIVSRLMEAIEALPVAGLIYAGAGTCANLGGFPADEFREGLTPQTADELFRILFYVKTQYPAVVESCGIIEPALSEALCELDAIASIARR